MSVSEWRVVIGATNTHGGMVGVGMAREEKRKGVMEGSVSRKLGFGVSNQSTLSPMGLNLTGSN